MFRYQCPKCEREYDFEERGDGYACEQDNTPLTRVYGFSGVIFKGGGFHKTDSRSKKSE